MLVFDRRLGSQINELEIADFEFVRCLIKSAFWKFEKLVLNDNELKLELFLISEKNPLPLHSKGLLVTSFSGLRVAERIDQRADCADVSD